jgi:hypothetical protein
MNGSVSALRFFFTVTLDRPNTARYLTLVREPRRLPVVSSEEEIVRLPEAAPGPKYRAAFSAAYGAGLRVSEVVALKVSDVDSNRMLLRIEQGKGQKDRFAMLSPVLLKLLRDWYSIARPAVWLFPGRDRLLPLTTRQFSRGVADDERDPFLGLGWGGASSGAIDPKCPDISGSWIWFTGDDVTIKPDGSVQTSNGGRARWICANGILVFRWSHGYIDRLTLSGDGERIPVWGRRN